MRVIWVRVSSSTVVVVLVRNLSNSFVAVLPKRCVGGFVVEDVAGKRCLSYNSPLRRKLQSLIAIQGLNSKRHLERRHDRNSSYQQQDREATLHEPKIASLSIVYAHRFQWFQRTQIHTLSSSPPKVSSLKIFKILMDILLFGGEWTWFFDGA